MYLTHMNIYFPFFFLDEINQCKSNGDYAMLFCFAPSPDQGHHAWQFSTSPWRRGQSWALCFHGNKVHTGVWSTTAWPRKDPPPGTGADRTDLWTQRKYIQYCQIFWEEKTFVNTMIPGKLLIGGCHGKTNFTITEAYELVLFKKHVQVSSI